MLDFQAGLNEIFGRVEAMPGMWTGAHIRILGLGSATAAAPSSARMM